MPKRKKAKNLQKEQPTRTPHPHNEKAPRSFHGYTPKFRKYHDCTLQVSHVHRCQVSARSNLHPEVSQCAKIQGFGLSKTTLRVSQCLPQSQTYTLQFPSLQNHLLSSQKVIKRHPEVLYAHEVREFRTIQRPNAPQPNTHTTPPKHFEVSDCLQNPHLSRENFTPWELDLSTARATANEHHILLTSSVSAPHAVYNVALLLRRRGTCSCTSSRPRTTAANSSFVRLVAPLHFGRAIKHIIAKVA